MRLDRTVMMTLALACILGGGQFSSGQLTPLIPEGGAPAGNRTSEHLDRNCIDIDPCLDDQSTGGSQGGACHYCAVPLVQKDCTGGNPPPDSICVKTLYRVSDSPPSCGARFLNGTLNANLRCIGGVPSGICYRVYCIQSAPA